MFDQMYAWVTAHPRAIGIALTLAVAFTKRVALMTPEQYAALPPRLAAVIKLMAALLPDLVKVAQVAPQVLTGKSDPAKIPVDVEEDKK